MSDRDKPEPKVEGGKFAVNRQGDKICLPGLGSYTLTDQEAADLVHHVTRNLSDRGRKHLEKLVGRSADQDTDQGRVEPAGGWPQGQQ